MANKCNNTLCTEIEDVENSECRVKGKNLLDEVLFYHSGPII